MIEWAFDAMPMRPSGRSHARFRDSNPAEDPDERHDCRKADRMHLARAELGGVQRWVQSLRISCFDSLRPRLYPLPHRFRRARVHEFLDNRLRDHDPIKEAMDQIRMADEDKVIDR